MNIQKSVTISVGISMIDKIIIDDEKSFSKAIIYYISGMTDNFAIDTYNKIIGF